MLPLQFLHIGQRISLRFEEIELKGHSLMGSAPRAEAPRMAAHLRDAIVERAVTRGHSAADVARTLGRSPGHWYRVKKEPHRLARLTLERLVAVSAYVDWTRVQAMVAVGWVQQSEIDQIVSPAAALKDAFRRLERGAVANGLVTPLAMAAEDHRMLMARLFVAAEGAQIRAANLLVATAAKD